MNVNVTNKIRTSKKGVSIYTMDYEEISALRFLDYHLFKPDYNARREIKFNPDYLAHKLAHHLYVLKKTYKINYTFIKSLIYTFRNNRKLDKYLREINSHKPDKSVCKHYFPYLDLSGDIWKSIKILSTDALVVRYLREYIETTDLDSMMCQYYDEKIDISINTFEQAISMVPELGWSEEVFRNKLLNKRIRKLNIAYIKSYILKENIFKEKHYSWDTRSWDRKTNEKKSFDAFYLPWMEPFLKNAIQLHKMYEEYLEREMEERILEIESREKEKNAYDWWDGIQPDFDWEEISDSDLRDSLRDLYD